MQWKLPLFKLNYSYLEKKAVDEVIKSNWLSMGEKTIELHELRVMLCTNYLKGFNLLWHGRLRLEWEQS